MTDELAHEIHGDGRTLLFVHGLALDRRLLVDAFEPAFAERIGWRRVYVDLPGHGASPAGATPPSAEGLLGALQGFVARVGGERPAIVAHAYGGYLAQGLVAAGPEPGGLFLVCPVVEPDFAARRVQPQRAAAVEEGLPFADDDERATFEGEVAVRTRATLDGFRRVVAPAHAATDRGFLAGVRGRYALPHTLRTAARAFAAPAALVCGHDDPWVGFVDAAELAAALPAASLAVLPGCGQLLPLEAGERLRAIFVDWLGRLA